MYTKRTIPHVYRKRDPTRIQEKKRSLMYTGEDLTTYLYRNDFTYLKSFVKEKTINSWIGNHVKEMDNSECPLGVSRYPRYQTLGRAGL